MYSRYSCQWKNRLIIHHYDHERLAKQINDEAEWFWSGVRVYLHTIILTFQEVPWGFFKLLMEIKSQYDNPPVFITENGWSNGGGLLDEDRIHYMRTYLNALLDAVNEGCDIKGYSMWSLIDTFEWRNGYL